MVTKCALSEVIARSPVVSASLFGASVVAMDDETAAGTGGFAISFEVPSIAAMALLGLSFARATVPPSVDGSV